VRTTRIPLGERLSGWVAATGQTAVNSDARLDLDENAREDSPLRSALAVPVMAKGRSVGVLSFYAREANAFDESHRRLMLAASLAVGPAMAQAADRAARYVTGGAQNSTRVLRNQEAR